MNRLQIEKRLANITAEYERDESYTVADLATSITMAMDAHDSADTSRGLAELAFWGRELGDMELSRWALAARQAVLKGI